MLTRELAREGRLTQLAIDIVDRPGQLAAVSAQLAEAGANIVEVSHQRMFSDLPAKGTLLELVIETRDRAHLDEVMTRLECVRIQGVAAGTAVTEPISRLGREPINPAGRTAVKVHYASIATKFRSGRNDATCPTGDIFRCSVTWQSCC